MLELRNQIMNERPHHLVYNSTAHHHRFVNRARKNLPLPLSAFVENKKPIIDEHGRSVSVRAEEVKRRRSESFWDIKNEALGVKDPQDYQVIVVKSPHRINKENNHRTSDVTGDILRHLKKNQMGKYPVGVFNQVNFANDKEARKIIGNEGIVPETVYLVASPLDEKELMNVLVIASHCKKIGVKKVVLVGTFLPFGREDKDGVIQNNKVVYSGQMLTLRAFFQAAGGLIDFVYTEEPHSSAEQAQAAEAGIPLAPISLWKFSIDKIKKEKDFDLNNLVIEGPDIGRNKAALGIGDDFGSPVVPLNKHRDPDTRTVWFDPLTEEQLDIVMGKNREGGRDFLMYDDEGASLDTAADILVETMDKYNPKSIRLILSHRRFTDEFLDIKSHYHKSWLFNLNRILETAEKNGIKIKIYLTDSREPIGEIESYERKFPGLVRLQKLMPFIFGQINEDVQGKNPWREHPEIILQD